MSKRFAKAFFESSKAMQNIYIFLILAAICLIKITIEVYPVELADGELPLWDYFKGNLLPELSGMIFEVLLFLFVIDVVRSSEALKNEKQKEEDALLREREKEKQEFHRKIQIERRLRTQLRVLIRRMFSDYKLSNGVLGCDFLFHACDYLDNQKVFVELSADIANDGEGSYFLEAAAECASFELEILLSIAQLNATLSDEHMKFWMYIIYFLKQISLHNRVLENMQSLLSNIANFEKASRAQNLDCEI
ncbi:hypothetical protein [Vibrio vulnificus]|uniref:hypothetical protein n=1 Tax=Vibrio vulnificus TaxID=672 RepID=UPI003ED8E7AE